MGAEVGGKQQGSLILRASNSQFDRSDIRMIRKSVEAKRPTSRAQFNRVVDGVVRNYHTISWNIISLFFFLNIE